MQVKHVSLYVQIERLTPRVFLVYISPIPGYILDVDVLQDLDLTTTTSKFCLRLCDQACNCGPR